MTDDDSSNDDPTTMTDLPELLFVHGIQDNVVPYTQTCEMVDSLDDFFLKKGRPNNNKCQEILLDDVGHADTVLDLMFGGVTRDLV